MLKRGAEDEVLRKCRYADEEVCRRRCRGAAVQRRFRHEEVQGCKSAEVQTDTDIELMRCGRALKRWVLKMC